MPEWVPEPDEPSRPIDHPVVAKTTTVNGFPVTVTAEAGALHADPQALSEVMTAAAATHKRARADSRKSTPRRKGSFPPQLAPLIHHDNVATTQEDADSLRDTRVRAVRLLRHYAPQKVSRVDTLLEKHKDNRSALLTELISEYGPEPEKSPSPFQERFERFYGHYNIPNVERLEGQLDEYAGKEEELMKQFVEIYGAEVEEEEKKDGSVDAVAVRARIVRFYQKWNPAKIPIVDELMSRIRNQDDADAVFRKLENTYGPEPTKDEVIPDARERSKSLRHLGGGVSASATVLTSGMQARSRATLPAPHAISLKPSKPSDIRQRLLRFYTHYNPDNIEKVDKVLVTYKGNEEELFRKLVMKYGPEPNEETGMSVDDQARGDYTAVLDSASTKTLQRLNSMSTSPSRSPASPAKKKIYIKVDSDPAKVRALVEANPKLPDWDADYEKWCGKVAVYVKDSKPDNTVALAFPRGGGAWFPKAACTIASAADAEAAFSPKANSPERPANTSFSTSALFGGPPSGAESPTSSFNVPSSIAKPVAEPVDDETDEEEEEEEEEEEDDVLRDGPAKEYIVNSKTYAGECSGTYILVEGETANGYPFWEREHSEANDLDAWLFSTPTKEWKVTDSKEDFETGDGYFNTDTHNGAHPHKAGPWLGEDDEVDPNISVVKKSDVDGDRVMGGHLVVGRVVAELTEEQLQYASFQRRKKFKVKKEIPASSKCAACKKFEAVCSTCYTNHRKVQKQRREYLKEQYPGMDLRRQVGVFFSAVAAGEDDDVKVMLDQGADVNWMAFFKKKSNEQNSLPEGGCHVSPLHVACAYHRPDVACTLIGAGARYRRDPNSMLPLDYIADDECAHDVTMYLEELTTEYATAIHVQEAWDIYNDEEYEEAREAFFELLMQYPDRDTCHLGLIYCHLGLGDIEACLESSRGSLKAPDVQWVECPKVAVQRAMERAMEIHHERAHAEVTEGCVKRCGCVVYPPEWMLPLKTLRKMDFKIMHHIFSFFPPTSSWNTWLALHRSPLLKKAVEKHIIVTSRNFKDDAVRVITSVPAWVASFREAVVDHSFDAWERKVQREGELAHVQVEGLECESIPAFPYFMMKVSVISRYHVPSNFTKMKGWWGARNSKNAGPRESISRAGSPSNGMLQGETFQLQLETPTEGFGINIVTNDNHVHNRKVRISKIESQSPACRSGVLPGYILKFNNVEIHNAADLDEAVAAARAEAILEIPIVVAVDVCEGSWVEGCGLNKRTELNGARGCVEQVNIKPATGGAVKVGFSEHGSVWMRPSNLIFIANDSSPVADDAASIGTSLVSSRVQSPSEHHGSNARSASHSALNDSCYSADSSNPAGHPNPVPLKRSRNEGYERFKREKLKLHLKRDTLIFNAHLVVPPHSHPVSLYHSTWPKWQLELQDTKALRPGVGTL